MDVYTKKRIFDIGVNWILYRTVFTNNPYSRRRGCIGSLLMNMEHLNIYEPHVRFPDAEEIKHFHI